MPIATRRATASTNPSGPDRFRLAINGSGRYGPSGPKAWPGTAERMSVPQVRQIVANGGFSVAQAVQTRGGGLNALTVVDGTSDLRDR